VAGCQGRNSHLAGRPCYTHTHTHSHLTALFPGLPGWAGTRNAKPIWILLKQETVSGSGISWPPMLIQIYIALYKHNQIKQSNQIQAHSASYPQRDGEWGDALYGQDGSFYIAVLVDGRVEWQPGRCYIECSVTASESNKALCKMSCQ